MFPPYLPSIHSLLHKYFHRKRAAPILEEILLIGIAIFIFAIIFGIILNLIDWSDTQLGDVFKK